MCACAHGDDLKVDEDELALPPELLNHSSNDSTALSTDARPPPNEQWFDGFEGFYGRRVSYSSQPKAR